MALASATLTAYLLDKGIAYTADDTSVILTGTLNPLQLESLSDACSLNAYGVWVVDGIACCVQDALDDGDVDTSP